jgi:DNA-binding MltR family transcriptional regulator
LKLLFGFHHGQGPTRIDSNPLQEILEGPDRACALVTAAICEKRIEQALRKHLLDNADLMNMLFQPEGPLGAFKPKGALAYAMGLVSAEAFHDIKIIVNVRNDFAHKFTVSGFGDQSISGRCANLKMPDEHYGPMHGPGRKQFRQSRVEEGLKDPRSRYIASCMVIANNIAEAIGRPAELPIHPPYV